MIINRINRAFGYFCLGEKIETALRFLQSADLHKLPPKRYEIDGTSIFAILQEYQTKPLENGFWESHQKYIDIQMVISGCELVGYSDLDDLQMLGYDETKDLVSFSGKESSVASTGIHPPKAFHPWNFAGIGHPWQAPLLPTSCASGSFLKVPADAFVIFYPYDAHMPGIMLESPQSVKKIVIKVSVD